MDVDGVLTDGRIWLLSRRDGTASEIKGFSAYDARVEAGAGRGFADGTYSRARESSAVEQRARECEIEFVGIKGARRSWLVRRNFGETTGASDRGSCLRWR